MKSKFLAIFLLTLISIGVNAQSIAKCKSITVYLNALGNAYITSTSVNNGSTFNPATQYLAATPTAFNCSQVGTPQIVTLQVVNMGTNQVVSSCTSVVTVKDLFAPILRTKDATIYLDANGAGTLLLSDINNGSSDNCGGINYTISRTSFDYSFLGDNVVTVSATDASGNTSTKDVKVTVIDTIAPIVLTNNITVTLINGEASITIPEIDNGSYDNCSLSYMFLSKQYFTCEDIGVNTITLTVVDESGNVGTNTAIITVIGTINNPINVSANTTTVYLGYQNSATITATGGNSYLWSTGETTNTITVSPISTTTYTVTENNPSACIQSSVSVTINVVDVRCGNKVKICHKEGPRGTINEICVAASAVPAHLAHGDKLGSCTTNARIQSTDALEILTFNIYPNPSNGTFTLTLPNTGDIKVYNTVGQVVFQKSITTSKSIVSLPNNILAGIYFVTITDGKNIYRKTINITK